MEMQGLLAGTQINVSNTDCMDVQVTECGQEERSVVV